MKRYAYIAALLLLSLCVIFLCGCSSAVIDVWNDLKRDDRTYLVAGLDDASGNTDVILLVTVNESRGNISVLQIPRDTFFSDEGYTGKINGIYPSLVARGSKEKAALEQFSTLISKALGVKIDGSAAVKTGFISDIATKIGGIDIELSEGIEIVRQDGSILILKSGKNHIEGEDIMLLIRHRSSYLSGDIGRMDMQKLVISALARASRRELGVGDMLSLVFSNRDDIITNLDFADIYNILLKNLGRNKEMRTCYATLPGTSDKLDDGLWYYFISKNAATKLFEELGLGNSLDAEGWLLAEGKENLYYEKEIKPRIYYNEELSEIRIN